MINHEDPDFSWLPRRPSTWLERAEHDPDREPDYDDEPEREVESRQHERTNP